MGCQVWIVDAVSQGAFIRSVDYNLLKKIGLEMSHVTGVDISFLSSEARICGVF